ncbi:S8 family serine peptidase [Peribacillus simplex]|uniref:S8 family peptidase n=1 Tax=Peribacillus simplex TaxID=1478 RepID=UPI00298A0380|nr:S8 family serine peptidase [Peribacillus simplex]MBX9955684.1 S8 family serine peptidase [Peribacillus simplex]
MKWVFMVGVIVSGLLMSIWINNPETIEIQDWEKEQKIPSLYDKQMESWGYKSLNIQGNKVHKRIIKIAIIDSGIDKSHPDIKGIVTKEYNAINPNNEIIDDTGHGTAVAGIIGAIDDKKGIRGVSKSSNLEIYSIKAFENSYSNEEIIKKALRWAIDQNVDIINFSAGASKANMELEKLIIEAINKDIFIISAAGNKFNNELQFPAYLPNVISVGAVNNEYKQVSGTVIKGVDFVGLGKGILTTFPQKNYNFLGYTSSSTAFVTGIVSDLLSQFSEFEVYHHDEIISILKDSAKKLKTNDGTKVHFIQNSIR